jgi:hypothetical protein
VLWLYKGQTSPRVITLLVQFQQHKHVFAPAALGNPNGMNGMAFTIRRDRARGHDVDRPGRRPPRHGGLGLCREEEEWLHLPALDLPAPAIILVSEPSTLSSCTAQASDANNRLI